MKNYESITTFYFVINLLFTVLIYVVPILIYRFGIKKVAFDDKKASKIAWSYSAIICFLMFFVKYFVHYDDVESGAYRATFGLGAALTWGFVNYMILSHGKIKEVQKDKLPKEITSETKPVQTNIPMAITELNEESNKDSSQPEKKQKESKKIFCKTCGSEVDQSTRKCSNCGKQYFKLPNSKITMIVSGIIILLLLGVIVYQQSQYKDELNNTNEALKEKTTEMIQMRGKAEFMDSSVVIVPDDGTKLYHKFECKNLNLDNGYWVYHSEAADSEDYKPCPVCIVN